MRWDALRLFVQSFVDSHEWPGPRSESLRVTLDFAPLMSSQTPRSPVPPHDANSGNESSPADSRKCARCTGESSTRCDQCGDPLCQQHIETSRGLAYVVFGPFLARRDVVLCNECYRERFWLAVRGAVAVASGMLGLVSALETNWAGAVAAILLCAAWWLIAGRCLAAARTEREQARRGDFSS